VTTTDRKAETHRCRGETETRAAACRLAAQLVGGELVALEGDLGAGKTVFVRGLAAALELDAENVSSPSFVLAIEHSGGRVPLLHVDLYRLPDGAGLAETGLDDALADGWVVAVEWAERLPDDLLAVAWRVRILPGAEDEERLVEISPPAG
jgi:tRNA threonylcarbamoyladenosine biosynthesis protein TsaE